MKIYEVRIENKETGEKITSNIAKLNAKEYELFDIYEMNRQTDLWLTKILDGYGLTDDDIYYYMAPDEKEDNLDFEYIVISERKPICIVRLCEISAINYCYQLDPETCERLRDYSDYDYDGKVEYLVEVICKNGEVIKELSTDDIELAKDIYKNWEKEYSTQ